MTVHITREIWNNASCALGGGYASYDTSTKAIEIALAEQEQAENEANESINQLVDSDVPLIPHITDKQLAVLQSIWYNPKDLAFVNGMIDAANAEQEQPLISAEEARKLGAGKAEWKTTTSVEGWNVCSERCEYLEFSWTHNAPYIYRAIKQE